MSKPKIIIITGPSGFNKTNLINRIVDNNDSFSKLVSFTDKPISESEKNGDKFHYVDEETFTQMVENQDFVEWQRLPITGYRYGKTKKGMQEVLDGLGGNILLAKINVINLPVFKRHYPSSYSIFLDVKDTQRLIDHLKQNKEDNEEEYQAKMDFATEERRRRHLADFIINMQDDFDSTIDEILKIVAQVGWK